MAKFVKLTSNIDLVRFGPFGVNLPNIEEFFPFDAIPVALFYELSVGNAVTSLPYASLIIHAEFICSILFFFT